MIRAVLFRVAKAYRNYRRPLWLALQRAAKRRIITVEDARSGLRFRCRQGAERMLPETCHLGLYDVPMAPVRPGDLVIDIGANHGFASCHFARRGADVEAYEPSPHVLPLLRANVALNGLEARVRVHPEAVTDTDGVATLHETDAMGGGLSSLLGEYLSRSGATIARDVAVPTVGILSVLRRHRPRRIRLLKVDCEGSEPEILRALDAEARSLIDAIAVEYHSDVAPLEPLLRLVGQWADFAVSKPTEFEFPNQVLHLVNRQLLEGGGPGAARSEDRPG